MIRASKGLRVIPTVSWGGEDTFEYCFDGIEKGSTVAVSTYMATAHGNHSDQKDFFLKGYRELLRRIEPETILCYNKPFPEMEGNIVYIDYDLSSWRHMDDELQAVSPFAKYICGAEPLPNNCHLTIKGGCVLRDKGMGSAFGGEWKPSKPEDERFLGRPSEIKRTQSRGRRGGYPRDTKIGEGGRAERARHYTDHDSPGSHTDPHDHEIDWSKGFPDPGDSINYPGGALEFKGYERRYTMSDVIGPNSLEENRFKTINDFKWCVTHGGEIELEYHDKVFGIFPFQKRTPSGSPQILLVQKFVENQAETERWYDTADDLLEYQIDGIRLRDVITEVIVYDRTI